MWLDLVLINGLVFTEGKEIEEICGVSVSGTTGKFTRSALTKERSGFVMLPI